MIAAILVVVLLMAALTGACAAAIALTDVLVVDVSETSTNSSDTSLTLTGLDTSGSPSPSRVPSSGTLAAQLVSAGQGPVFLRATCFETTHKGQQTSSRSDSKSVSANTAPSSSLPRPQLSAHGRPASSMTHSLGALTRGVSTTS